MARFIENKDNDIKLSVEEIFLKTKEKILESLVNTNKSKLSNKISMTIRSNHFFNSLFCPFIQNEKAEELEENKVLDTVFLKMSLHDINNISKIEFKASLFKDMEEIKFKFRLVRNEKYLDKYLNIVKSSIYLKQDLEYVNNRYLIRFYDIYITETERKVKINKDDSIEYNLGIFKDSIIFDVNLFTNIFDVDIITTSTINIHNILDRYKHKSFLENGYYLLKDSEKVFMYEQEYDEKSNLVTLEFINQKRSNVYSGYKIKEAYEEFIESYKKFYFKVYSRYEIEHFLSSNKFYNSYFKFSNIEEDTIYIDIIKYDEYTDDFIQEINEILSKVVYNAAY